jgi:putative ABC transport system permease protein
MSNAGYTIERLTGNTVEAFFEEGNRLDYKMQPLSNVYYEYYNPVGPEGNKTYIMVFGGIAVLVLLLACINYMNLTTARSIKRAREVGLRKVIGSTRRQLIAQFLIESVLYSLSATVLAVFFGELMYATLADIFEIRWDLRPLSDLSIILFTLGIALMVGVVAGVYPALSVYHILWDHHNGLHCKRTD